MNFQNYNQKYAHLRAQELEMRRKYYAYLEEQKMMVEGSKMGIPASTGGSSIDSEYTPGSGWAQWNNEPWSTLDTPWSELV
jgi:hypothetical protein